MDREGVKKNSRHTFGGMGLNKNLIREEKIADCQVVKSGGLDVIGNVFKGKTLSAEVR